MKHKTLVLIMVLVLLLKCSIAQAVPQSGTIDSSDSSYNPHELKGLVLDHDKQTALPYATIYVLHTNKGAVSNEHGHFTIDISGLGISDTLRFQYIGFKTRNIPLSDFDSVSTVYLQEEIFNLNEVLVFGSNPDPREIVKKVLENKAQNYKASGSRRQVFVRERHIQDVVDFDIKYKKSTIDGLDEKMIDLMEDKFPRNFTSFTDFLGDLYFNKKLDDSIIFKVNPIKMVELKEKDIAEPEMMESTFENVFKNTNEGEYWKVKSGLFGSKIEMDSLVEEKSNDSLDINKRKVKDYARSLNYNIMYSSLTNKDQWEFLHKTGKYDYSLAGGTRVNGEDVYIIDFTPKSSGVFSGRMFIAMNTYALIRADYDYAPGKIGRDFQFLGVGYTETGFGGSVYFEKKDDRYVLKYFAFTSGSSVNFDRPLALIKKRTRFLFDKKLKEIRVNIDVSLLMRGSVEYLVLSDEDISAAQFAGFTQPETMEVIYVDQFDDKLWQGFSIIEPTRQMKEYKKQELNFKSN